MIGFHGPELLILAFTCLTFFILVPGTIFWIWMLVDCVRNEPSEGNDKIVWMLIIVFLHFIGGLIYYFVRRPERRRLLGR
jgi:hypothetical protein